MTKREFFENELKMKPSDIGTAVPFNPNGETEVTEEWLVSLIKNLLAERSDWHTGIPTEKGWYLIVYRFQEHFRYTTDYFLNARWTFNPIMIEEKSVAWQKIELYKEN